MILNFRNVYLDNVSTVCGPYEAKGPLSHNFDKKYNDLYAREKSFEKAEIRLLEDSIRILLKKTKLKSNDIDLVIAGDLLNQIASSSYGALNLKSPSSTSLITAGSL